MRYTKFQRENPELYLNRAFNSIWYGAPSMEEAALYSHQAWMRAFNKCFADAQANGTYPPDKSLIPDPKDFKYWYQLELNLVGGKINKPIQ